MMKLTIKIMIGEKKKDLDFAETCVSGLVIIKKLCIHKIVCTDYYSYART